MNNFDFDLMDFLAIIGFGLMTTGLAMWSVPLALIVDGVLCIWIAAYVSNLKKNKIQLPK